MGTARGEWVEEGRGPRGTELCFQCPHSPPSVCVCVCGRMKDSKVALSLISDPLAPPSLCPPIKAPVKQSSLPSVKPTANTAALTTDYVVLCCYNVTHTHTHIHVQQTLTCPLCQKLDYRVGQVACFGKFPKLLDRNLSKRKCATPHAC